jgi:hypothetical protein
MARNIGAAATERIENPFAARRSMRAERPAPVPDLQLRDMTGYEEEVVERRRGNANTAALCNELVARCMVAPGADHAAAYERVRSFSVAERDVALISLRRSSFGDLVELEVSCTACNRKNEVDFQLGALPVSLGAIEREVEATLPDGTLVSMRLPTAGDQEDLLNAELETESERRTFLLACTLQRFGDREGPFDFDFARALPIASRNCLEKALEARIPDLDLRMAVTCVACGHSFSAPFDVAAFFLPS